MEGSSPTCPSPALGPRQKQMNTRWPNTLGSGGACDGADTASARRAWSPGAAPPGPGSVAPPVCAGGNHKVARRGRLALGLDEDGNVNHAPLGAARGAAASVSARRCGSNNSTWALRRAAAHS